MIMKLLNKLFKRNGIEKIPTWVKTSLMKPRQESSDLLESVIIPSDIKVYSRLTR